MTAVTDPAAVVSEREAEPLDAHPDAAQESVGHCKDAPHLRVTVKSEAGHGPLDQQVRRVDKLVCKNDRSGYRGWGAVIDPAGKNPGMQLFPGGVAYLAAQLPAAADAARAKGAGWSVIIQHTSNKVLINWRTFTPEAADVIGTALAAMS